MTEPGDNEPVKDSLGAIDAVVFDAVGTLIFPRPSVAEAYQQAAQHFGIALPRETIQQRFRDAFARQEARDAERTSPCQTSETHEHARWRAIVAEVFPECADEKDAERLFTWLWDHFAAAKHWRVEEHADAVMAELIKRGKRLAIGSNFDHRLHDICAGLGLAPTARLFVSSELGVRKPAPEFFAHVSSQLNVASERILMVGDDWRNDIAGARSAGWQAVYVSRKASQRSHDTARRRGVITSLRELPGLCH